MNDEIPKFNKDGLIMDLTQCCGVIVYIYTDYSEGGELLIPICSECNRQVTTDGKIEGEEE